MIYLVNETWPETGDTSFKMCDTLLRAAGLSRANCHFVSLFPPNIDRDTPWGGKKGAQPNYKPIRQSRYITPEGAALLKDSLSPLDSRHQNDWVIAFGPVACWALLGHTDLTRRRGALHENNIVPTYSPAQVTRQYLWFPLVVSDLSKAADADHNGWSMPDWDLRPRPTIEELREFCTGVQSSDAPLVFDIETSPKFRAITAIGLGQRGIFMCIPFLDEEKRGCAYWDRAEDELEAVRLIKGALEKRGTLKIAHHSSYDTSWLWMIFGIRVAGPLVDTRIMHHTLVPELPHTLGSIAHTYALLPPWKAQHAESKET